jgi:hypothetical protein
MWAGLLGICYAHQPAGRTGKAPVNSQPVLLSQLDG